MIDYYNGQLTDILPVNFTQSPSIKALSYALQQGCRLLNRYSRKLYIYADLDSQPENVIDLLAAELRTQYYRGDLEIETKKRLVENTLVWYMTAGTPQTVEELATAVFGDGRVQEWFEYGGEPYYFRIITDAPLAVTPEKNRLFYDMLKKVKNTRSHIQAIEIHREENQGTCAGIGQRAYCRPPAVMAYPLSVIEGRYWNATDI